MLLSGKKLAFFVIIIISESLNLNDDDKMPLEPFQSCWSQGEKKKRKWRFQNLKSNTVI